MLNSINQSHNNDNTLAYINLFPQEVEGAEEEEDNKLQVGTLFDSGATKANYINVETANRLEMRGAIRYHNTTNNIVCSGIIGTPCTKAHGYMNINIAFTVENSSAHRYQIRVLNCIHWTCRIIVSLPEFFLYLYSHGWYSCRFFINCCCKLRAKFIT